MLKQLQDHFFDYLLHGNEAFAQDINSSAAISADVRLQIYGNAYRMRLREALDTDHEMLGLYLGDELYDQMVAGFVAAYPSHYTSLRHYGDELPAFLREHEPFSVHPILAEIAAFERLLLDAFDAAESSRASFNELQTLSHERWPELRLRFHPSLQLFVAKCNSVESWQALKKQETPDAPDNDHRRCWMIWRGEDRLTQFRSIHADEEALLRGFLQGESFADNCETLMQWYSADDVPTNALRILHAWFEDGMVRGIF